ncbi:hypothetical protein C482_02461, partial [Natrialba chahannaoensis JCM 10990]
MLQAAGAAGTAATLGVGGGGVGTVAAGNFSFEGTCDSAFAYAFPISCAHADPDSDTNDDVTPDETIMHQSATSEKASYDAAYITASNHLTDTVSIAA